MLEDVLTTLEKRRRQERTVLSTTADRAASVVREQVTEGALRSGTRLPEAALAQAIGVSRNTLREALSQLVAERILVREPHRGVVVATPDADDVTDVYRARLVIEVGAVLDGTMHDEERLAALDRAVAEGRDATEAQDWPAVASANQHFHRALVALAGSSRLDAEMELLLAEMRLFFNEMTGPESFHRPYLDQNATIAAHLRAGRRAEAAAVLRDYLTRARDQLRDALTRRASTR
ncbi:GntR family transcriptional regulator [Knoellia remsis]|uniref:GntR family transcriptional regulator n=1 Tax=Knoellia remsis TaxID=407159 RepID=A0A2T0UQT8_9MICO|nr:GntR family transcriptional regulator [Knoellia remsis]PRY60290.1 GntR family transcriptional regulator [Knoellia remsis]